ncbi:hypothetical protein QUF72_20425 [Desulfobacterales bacterium HSG2]|nr:hypothetical protein [Desulfobacterales bacterium HSG2]
MSEKSGSELTMNDYHKEQSETFSMVRQHLATLSSSEKDKLKAMIADYLSFREETDAFLCEHFGGICIKNCYESRLSACCSREGIITFFADAVINMLVSRDDEIENLMAVLEKPNNGFKCVYLGEGGCMWQVKPIVCEMFMCDQAQKEVFEKKPHASQIWDALNQRKKQYTWPDRPILFDALEQCFLDAGYSSPLMYLHNSPGLLRVKERSQSRT